VVKNGGIGRRKFQVKTEQKTGGVQNKTLGVSKSPSTAAGLVGDANAHKKGQRKIAEVRGVDRGRVRKVST